MIPEGERNTRLTKQAGAIRRAGASEAGLLAALKAENAACCRPPLDDQEIAGIVASVLRYPVGPMDGDQAEAVMQAVLDQHFAGGAHLLRAFDGRFWWYDGRCWAPLSEKVLEGRILTTIQGLPLRPKGQTAPLIGQVVRLIGAKVAADGDVLRFMAPPLPVINCRNGELWIKDNGRPELRPHRADSFLRHCLDVDYDPLAVSADYDDAIKGIFAKASDPAAMVRLWHELMGYMLQPGRPIPLITLGWGGGNNGKTKLVETFVRLVGRELIVAMPIGDIDKSRFTGGNLLGKLAIIDDDVKAGTRLPDGQLKRLSEEKTITGENKFGPPFTFTVRTAILMLFNPPPTLADLSHGMQRRLIVVPFARKFSDQEANSKLFPQIWAEEMPGVLNRYLDGLRQVIRRGWRFEPPADSLDAKAELLKAANPVPAFLAERCEEAGSAYVQALYKAYRDWAHAAGITIAQQRLGFQRNLESLGYKVGRGNQGPKIQGLRLRS
ncbi:phage/plasmid primase, P4 family [Methylobacterium sp. J-026]|uniref:phage/plasmid primase, P4 family n=1 Tax=Methylobacterium sp. J-026 TaxID=2836624 RepID=UPI001FB9CAEC|nr:phage/plasmid primase, P4 family [Methylobacterium sp. J-026]MCJ2137439.1 phage/plasmid primase, P4 family [Methylobacterium sp. J-026]